MKNQSNSLDASIFQKLILCKAISMKSLDICFGEKFLFQQIQKFFKFLKCSRIQFLNLLNLNDTEGFDSPDFCEFLRNSDSLVGLGLLHWYLRDKSKIFKLDLLLQELSFNKTIKVLLLIGMHLPNFSSNLANFISENKSITTLVLHENDFKIDLQIINAILKNPTLEYLVLVGAKLEDDYALKLSKSNLKGINVDYAEVAQSSKDLIYKAIPKIKYFWMLIDNEIYLRSAN